MKKKNIFQLLVVVLLASSFTLKFATTTFKVVPEESTVKWLGKKVTGQHNGSVAVKSGEVLLDGKTLKGGNLVIDMTTIANEDGGFNKRLVDHLKSDDFFGVEKYPTSKFEITKVKALKAAAGKPNYEVTGKLTIKATTEEITTPVLLTVDKGFAKVKGTLIIDRSKYDIRYGSTSFFDNLGDKAIHNDFEMDFEIVSKK